MVIETGQHTRVVPQMFTRTAGIVAAGVQNRRVIFVGTGLVTELTEVQGIVVQLSQNSQKYRVLWRDGHRTHRSRLWGNYRR